jgi:glycosyltransferase involved in cell wall biosynthesis
MNNKEFIPGLISVILPVYNAVEFIEGAISSILNQTYTNFELIIIDDGSTDNSPELIIKFNDPRISFYSRKNEGLVTQLNFGLSVAKGEFIARMDADDLCVPERFELQLNFLRGNSNVRLIGTNFYYIDNKGDIIVEKKLPEFHNEIEFMMPVTASVLHPTIMTYKKDLEVIMGYYKTKLYAEDHDLFLRLIENGCIIHNIQLPLYSYRIGNGSLASRNVETQQNNVYLSGIGYLNRRYSLSERNRFEYLFRTGLLEYYRGDVNKARNIFLRIIFSEPNRILSVLRYTVVSFLGNKVIKQLRKRNILQRISFFMNKYFHKDFNSFNKPQ